MGTYPTSVTFSPRHPMTMQPLPMMRESLAHSWLRKFLFECLMWYVICSTDLCCVYLFLSSLLADLACIMAIPRTYTCPPKYEHWISCQVCDLESTRTLPITAYNHELVGLHHCRRNDLIPASGYFNGIDYSRPRHHDTLHSNTT